MRRRGTGKSGRNDPFAFDEEGEDEVAEEEDEEETEEEEGKGEGKMRDAEGIEKAKEDSFWRERGKENEEAAENTSLFFL